MSDEYETSESTPSLFWPLLVLVLGLLIWAGYQDYAVNAQRSFLKQNLVEATPVFNAAQTWQGRYNAMMKDLIETANKDPYAAQIAKEAVQAGIQAGLIRVQQPAAGGTNTTTNPTPPAATTPSSTTPPK